MRKNRNRACSVCRQRPRKNAANVCSSFCGLCKCQNGRFGTARFPFFRHRVYYERTSLSPNTPGFLDTQMADLSCHRLNPRQRTTVSADENVLIHSDKKTDPRYDRDHGSQTIVAGVLCRQNPLNAGDSTGFKRKESAAFRPSEEFR